MRRVLSQISSLVVIHSILKGDPNITCYMIYTTIVSLSELTPINAMMTFISQKFSSEIVNATINTFNWIFAIDGNTVSYNLFKSRAYLNFVILIEAVL